MIPLDARAQLALARARAAAPPGGRLTVELLLAALCREPEIAAGAMRIAMLFAPVSPAGRSGPGSPAGGVAADPAMDEDLAELLEDEWPPRREPLSGPELFRRALLSPAGRRCIADRGLEPAECDELETTLGPSPDSALPPLARRDLRRRLVEIRRALCARDAPRRRRGAPDAALDRFDRLCEHMGFTPGELAPAGGLGSVVTGPRALESGPVTLDATRPQHEMHNLGNELYRRELYDIAIEFYTLALLCDGSLLETYFNRGLALIRLKRYAAAAADLTKALELNPRLPETHYTLGLCREYAGRFAEAIDHYEQALEIDPRYDRAAQQIEIARRKMSPPVPQPPDEEQTMRGDPDHVHDSERLEQQREARALRDALRQHYAQPPCDWRGSELRERVLGFLTRVYGDLLTRDDLEDPQLSDVEPLMETMCCTLQRILRRNILLLGQAGTGKTALVRELACRLRQRRPPFSEDLADLDILELIPARMQGNTKYAGTYEERVENLVTVLSACRQVIVFVDEIHGFFRSSFEGECDVFWRGNQRFKSFLADGTAMFIGCTTPAEYRRHMEPDKALTRRFTTLRVEPPGRATTRVILARLQAKLADHYRVAIGPGLLERVVELADEHLPARYQPDKSIQLFEEALSRAKLRREPSLTEECVRAALGGMIGHPAAGARGLREDALGDDLRRTLKGQDATMREIAHAVVAGLGDWVSRRGPRGVFLFAGPTGVGKTETAVRLAEILGAGQQILVRIDCNLLQGLGWNSEEITRRLIGPPPGFARSGLAEGGLLCAVREHPEGIVLFDEFEKADPTVAKLLLQVIDNGQIHDAEDHVLDFRRTFIILTTNLGFDRQAVSVMGFATGRDQPAESRAPAEARRAGDGRGPRGRTDIEAFRSACRRHGLTGEFLTRITHTFLFNGLERATGLELLSAEIDELRANARRREMDLVCGRDVIPHLADLWDPHEGARQLQAIVRRHLLEPLSAAEACGELQGARRIRLRVSRPVADSRGEGTRPGHRRRGGTVSVYA